MELKISLPKRRAFNSALGNVDSLKKTLFAFVFPFSGNNDFVEKVLTHIVGELERECNSCNYNSFAPVPIIVFTAGDSTLKCSEFSSSFNSKIVHSGLIVNVFFDCNEL